MTAEIPRWSKKTWKNRQRGKKILPGNGGIHNGAKKRALKRDKFTCQRCGIKLFDKDSKRTRDKRKAVVHHIIPLAEGGKNNFDNLLSTCRPCEDKCHDMGTLV